MVEEMLHDKRDIRALHFPKGASWIVGQGKIDKIEVYREPGQEAMVPWFAVWVGGKIEARVNASMVESVIYAVEE